MRYFLYSIALLLILSLNLGFITNGNGPTSTATKEIEIPTFCKASPDPTVINQSDGSSITIVGKGNMNNYWTETTDGYSIVRNKKGVYEYANKVNGSLIPSGIKANDIGNRTLSETAHLNITPLSLQPNFNPLKSSVLNQVNAHLKNKTYPTTGNINVLALLIEYPDLDSTFAVKEFDSLLYGANFRSGDGSFKSFYETSSNGQLTITVDVEGWFEADSNHIYYGVDSGYGRAADLVREAVDAAETAGVDFSQYDNDSDGDVDGILAIHSGPGAEQGSQGEYIWSHRWVLNGGTAGQVTYDGVRINDYMINPETRTAGAVSNLVGIGVICHEFGHNLGLPDLYDTDDINGGSEGIGEWGLMGSAGYLGNEHRPGNLCAWARIDLGWDNPTLLTIGQSGEYKLPPASLTQDAIFKVNTSKANEYFLLENRQKVGLDSDLRGNGLAIWHINTNKTGSSGNSVNADENVKGVDLEEADGANDLDDENNRADDGDLFPGSSSATTFDDLTNPNAKVDTGINAVNSNLRIASISELNDTVFFSFGPAPGPACSTPDTLTTASGSFTDGSGNTEYAHNQNCSWLIQVPAGTVTLNFSKFKTEPTNDSVTVYDGTDATAAILGSFSGTTIPGSLTSSTADMYIEFNTNATLNDSGWAATYTSNVVAMGCGTDTLTTLTGTFTDGSGTTDYDNNLSCSWLIEPAGAMSITFGLDSLNTEVSKDKITIYDGSTNSAPVLGSYSGTNNLNTLTSSGGTMFVEFKTDGANTDRGWGAYYNASTAGLSCTGSTTFTASSGSFNDGSGANDYSNNRFCTWLINPPSGQIEMSFINLKTEANLDRVLVFDGMDNTAPQIGSYSGTTIPAPIVSSSNVLYLEFRTNGTVVDEGWDISYQPYAPSTCQGDDTLTTSIGTFGDGSGSENYTDTLDCTWLIQPPGATSITLNFNSFELENGNDSLIIYNGTDATGTKIGAYTGNVIPAVLTVNSGNVFMEFITNNTINNDGWELTYTSTPICSGTTTLTGSSGNFTDGSGANDYENDLDCSWLIQPPGSPNNIILTVNSLELAFGFTFPPFSRDEVRIYDGNNSSGTLITILTSFSNLNFLPAIIATSGEMYIEFETNTNTTDEGWDFSYTTSEDECAPLITYTTNTGRLTDGTANFVDYGNNLDCSWLIQPSSPNRSVNITFAENIFFDYFDLDNTDTVFVHDGASTADPILRKLTGSLGSTTVNSTGGSMLVTFQTDASGVDNGWTANYTTSIVPTCTGTTTLTTASGTFDDGSSDGIEYTPNNNCSWLIQPAGVSLITLSFDRFDTESGNDEVTVYDGSNASATVLGTFSGNNLPNTIQSSGGSLFVQFNTNGSDERNGWEATYNSTSNQCVPNVTYTAAVDTIEDGSGSNNYDNNLNCNWLIQPPTATSISLEFLEFDLAAGDTITMHNGSTNSSPRVGRYFGPNNVIPPILTSSTGTMLIEFKTDGSSTADGWEAAYSITSTKSCIGTTTLTTSSGSFTDGSGADNYDNSLGCSWLIQPTNNPVGIAFTMDSIKLANTGDFVRVYNGSDASAPLLATYTNGSTNTVIAYSGSMFVEFITDNVSVDEGWGASYVTTNSYCAPNTTLTGVSGFFDDGSPSIATDYLNNTDCEWLIEPSTPNLAISLRFTRFSTTGVADSVTVYDGSTTSDPILGTFSGGAVPSPVISTGSSMLVTFKTDGATTSDGWRASYITFPLPNCSGQTTLTAASGTFDDGSANGDNYGPFSNCTWLIEPTGAISIDLDFNRFATQAVADVVTIYDGNTTAAPTLGTFSGTTIPATVSSGGSMLVEFTTNGSFERNGWEASYTSSNTVNLSANKDTVTINAGAGSTGNFNVTSNGSWTTSDNAIWLTASPLNGTQNQTVNLQAIQGNIGPIRYAEVYISSTVGSANDTVVVEQLSSGRYLVANPDTIFFTDIPATSQDINILSNVNWNLTSSASWFTIGTLSGTNNGSSAITAQNNTTTQIRSDYVVASGNLGVSNDTIHIVQEISSTTPRLEVTPKSLVLAQPFGSLDSFTVNSNVVWQASVGDPWLTLTLPPTTSDTGKIIVTANSMNPNTSSRSTFIAIENVQGGSPTLFDTVFVDQEGLIISLSGSPDTVLLSSTTASTASVTVNSNTNWVATEGDPWFSPSPSSGNSDGTITLTTNSANSLSTQRVSFLELSDAANGVFDTVIVIQDTAAIGLTTNPDTIRVNSTVGSTNTFTISTGFGWVTVVSEPWISITPNSGNGSSTVTVTANSDNPLNVERVGYVAVDALSGAIYQDTVYVVQEASQAVLTASPSNINLGFASGSNDQINVTSNTNWTVTNPASWLTIAPSSGSNNGSVTVTAASDNLTGASRSATLTFSAFGAIDQLVTITQIDGSTPIFEVSVDTVFVDNPQGSIGTFSILSNQSNWSLSESTSWLLINPASGSNTTIITALVASKNILGQDRYAEVTASATGFADKTVVIAQEKSTPLFQVSPTAIALGPDSTDFANFNISSNMNSWKVSENASWFKVSPDSGSFTSQIRIEATETNNSSIIRSEVITITSPPLVSKTVTVTQDTVWAIGIKEIAIENAIKLYPNPTSSVVTLELTNSVDINSIEFEIYNLLGEKMQLSSNQLSTKSVQFDLGGYAKGIYFVRMNYHGKVFSKKVSLLK